ncbi:MAG: site-specific DNA-methyltransferase, partial [Magnetovibrio sp.]|nr:site-specific DNA-methyltransferase [Magnetovibrio sp.]
AKKLHRRYVGIEREAEYAALAEERLRKVHPLAEEEFLKIELKKEQPRIPFGWLVERGLLEPGQVLTDTRRRHTARIRSDGTLTTDGFRGSIHQVGAYVQKAPACNGWQFWCVERRGELVPIDAYRQKLRAELH